VDPRITAADRVREGLSAGNAAAVTVVRTWVATTVRRWRLGDPEAVIQEVTMKVVRLAAEGRVKPDLDFRGFVATVTRHACIDAYRKDRVREFVELPLDETDVQDLASGPEERLDRREHLQLLRFVFQAMPEECLKLWRWIYAEGRSAAEVGERLGLTANNVRVRTHRCLVKAREIRMRFFPSGIGGRP